MKYIFEECEKVLKYEKLVHLMKINHITSCARNVLPSILGNYLMINSTVNKNY